VGDDVYAAMVEDAVARQIEAQQAYMMSTQNAAFHSSYETAQNALFKLQQYAAYLGRLDVMEAPGDAEKHAEVWDAMMDHFGSNDD
jgi:hypothetical protein